MLEVLPILEVIYPTAMTVPVFSKKGNSPSEPILFGMAHTGARRGVELPPAESMENLGSLPYFSGSMEGENRPCDGAATKYPIPNWHQRTASYDIFMTVSSGNIRPGNGRLAMYWDRKNNYGAKCYGLEYAEQPLLMNHLAESNVAIGKNDNGENPLAQCPNARHANPCTPRCHVTQSPPRCTVTLLY